MSYYSSSGNGNVGSIYNMVKIKNPDDQPIDTVQDICIDPFNQQQHGFLAGGWDGFIRYGRIIGTTTEEIEIPFSIFLEHPVVAVAIGRNNVAFAGLSSGDIVAVDMSNSNCQLIGAHEGTPICKLFWIDNYSLLLSLGYDQRLKFWNLSDNNGNFLAQDFNLPFKTHTAAYDHPYLMIGTADGQVGFMNLSNLQNFRIPPQNFWFAVMEFGSKFTCSTIKAKSKLFAVGCADGRKFITNFKENYNGGIQVDANSSRKMYSKAQKRQSGYGHSPQYGQINDIDIGQQKNGQYLILSGTEEISFFNLYKREKSKRIKIRATCGKLTYDGAYFVFAEGSDWLEGIHQLKKPTKPKLEIAKFTRSELEELVKQK